MIPASCTRDDLVEMLGVPGDRIDVVPLGVRSDRIDVVPLGLGGVRRATPLSERETRARFDLGERRVVLSLSAKRPHKNLLALIGALARIPSEDRPLLVLPGYPTAGEAALLFDPRDQSAIAAALGRLLDDSALREQLRARGLARVAEFTWERTARLTLESYRRTLRPDG